jgi:hypothetical protein
MKSIMYVILSLAAFGLIFKLLVDPSSLIYTLLIAAAVVTVFYGIYRFLQSRQGGNSTHMRKYRQAVKQSKKKNQHRKVIPKRRSSHLTVIDGKKNKKKNGAL